MLSAFTQILSIFLVFRINFICRYKILAKFKASMKYLKFKITFERLKSMEGY
jgi:hypothetical protein